MKKPEYYDSLKIRKLAEENQRELDRIIQRKHRGKAK